MAGNDQPTQPTVIPIELGYAVPERTPHLRARRRFAMIRAWVYAIAFTGLAAFVGAVLVLTMVREGPSRESMLGAGFMCFVLGSLVYRSFQSIVKISDGRASSPFE